MTSTPDPYADLAAFQALPRTSGLQLSPDGTRLVTTVAELDPDGARFVNALWEVDPTGETPARRLTRSTKGEGAPVFAADGSLLFTSARPGPDDKDDEPPALWRLPVTGEAEQVGTRPGGVSGVQTARDAPVVVVLSDTLPGSTDDDADRRTARKDAKVSAVLHDGFPVRSWDHDLGVGSDRLLVGQLGDGPVTWLDLTPEPGRAFVEASLDLSPDGRTVVTTWAGREAFGSRRTTLVMIDTETGEQRGLPDDGTSEHSSPRSHRTGGTWPLPGRAGAPRRSRPRRG